MECSQRKICRNPVASILPKTAAAPLKSELSYSTDAIGQQFLSENFTAAISVQRGGRRLRQFAALGRPGPGHQFVFNIVVGCDAVAAENGQPEMNQPWSVTLGFVRNRADQRAIDTRNLFQSLRNTILSDDGHIFLAP